MRLVRRIGFPAAVSLLSASLLSAAPPAKSADQIRPLLIGTRAPALTLEQADGSAFDLGDAMASKPTILIFYRGGW